MISYHRILTEALQLCLREGHLDQTRANIIQAAFDESVVGAPVSPTPSFLVTQGAMQFN